MVSVTEGVVLSVGVRELLTQMLGVQLPVHLRVDNTAALQLIEGKGANRTRHLRIRSSFVREKVEQGELLPSHVPGERQLADLLTKVLPGPRLQLRRSMIGMREREQRVPIDTIQGVESPDNHQVQSVTCTDALQRCLLFLVACLQVQSADGQDDEVQRLEVDPPYELMLLTALVVLSVLALWEGGRSPVQCVPLGIPRGLGQLLRFERASVEEKVQEAIKKELEGSGMRQRGRDALADSSSSRPVNSEPMPVPRPPPIPPPPAITEPAASSYERPRRTTTQTQEVQTDVPYPDVQAAGIPTHQVFATMQRGGVVHLFADCGTLGVPAYRQERAICQR